MTYIERIIKLREYEDGTQTTIDIDDEYLKKYFITREKVEDLIETIKKEYENSKDEQGYYTKPHYSESICVLKRLLEDK